ncbi:capsular polysaccharide biosynthesis protein [Bordetella ansorpii]|uniref:Capsular polysaccharide biosynthesis protein n=1 Tax=Bordetella ansorpii TaxID=288768 RepID=A0A157STU9_9BORD|nr:polysaccharide biosynthesis tyrosine autokinase [Bordetella ansorpii]SAI73869.1 capsular polysaccharide biosynthesis protein [Bordetella ansorpii]
MNPTPDISADAEAASFSNWIDTLLQHGGLAMVTFGLVLAAGLAYAFLATPIFRADVLIQVEDKKPAALEGIQNLADTLGASTSPVTGEIEILRSRGVILKALESTHAYVRIRDRRCLPVMGCWLAPRGAGESALQVDDLSVPQPYLDKPLRLRTGPDGSYRLEYDDGTALTQGKVGQAETFTIDGLPASITVTRMPTEQNVEFDVIRLAPVTAYREVLRQLIVAESGRDSNMIRLSYEHPDSSRAYALVNAIASAYLAQNVERRSAEAQQSLNFLSSQLPEIERNVEKNENSLNDFRTRTGVVDVDKSVEALLKQGVDIEKSRLELELQRQELLQRFTASHPAVKAIDSQLSQTRQASKQLMQRISEVPEGQRDLLRLQRDVNVSTQLYTAILDTVQQLKVARAGTTGNVRIIDLAIHDDEPVAPRKLLVALGSALLGAALGIAAAMTARNLRPTLRDVEELERLTGLSAYASIPESRAQERLRLDKHKRTTGDHKLLALLHPDEPAVESLRALCIGLAFARLEARDKSIVITGPTASIGKSFISANLAILLAATGKRVLLIETDLRQPKLNQYFGLPRRSKGLSDLLIGDVPFEAAIHNCPVAAGTLHVMASGPLPPNPAELLQSAAFRALMQDVQGKYDQILLDAPPVLPISDTLAVSGLAASTFMVVRAERSTVDEVRMAIKKVVGAGGNVKGLLFNGVMQRRIRFKTSYQYYYRYGKSR